MKRIDCTGIENEKQLHQLLARELAFPDYYGHNLNALFDCLTDIRTDTQIVLKGWDGLGQWKDVFTQLFADAAEADPHLKFIVKD